MSDVSFLMGFGIGALAVLMASIAIWLVSGALSRRHAKRRWRK